MLYRNIFRVLSLYLVGFSATLLIPLLIAGYYEFLADPVKHPQPHSTIAFLATIICTLALAGTFSYFAGRSNGQLYRREGLVAVVAIWIITSIISALPFRLSGTLENMNQAVFEAISGLSTTGATVMTPKRYDPLTGEELPITVTIKGIVDTTYRYYGTIKPLRDPVSQKILHEGIEAVSKALLFWRSFTEWLGGLGIVVIFVAVLPVLGVGGKLLFQAEIPGPSKEALTPRVKETAIRLWGIYGGLTVLQIILLKLTNANLPWFDVINIAFTTISTGGFSIRNGSIASYGNPITEWIIIIFMVLGGVNFSLFYYALRGKFYRLYDTEFLLYISILIITCGLAAWYLVGQEKVLLTGESPSIFSMEEAIRYGTFQMVSLNTTTGFISANYEKWPYVIQVLMLLLMWVGGMSGSTSGGIKTVRHYMLFRIAHYKIESLFRPDTVRKLRISGKEVDSQTIVMTLCFFLLVIGISALGTLLYVFDGIDPESSLSLAGCMINNVGIGFRAAGPAHSCAFLSDFSLVLSSALMLLGRLEFFAVLALLVPAFWRKAG